MLRRSESAADTFVPDSALERIVKHVRRKRQLDASCFKDSYLKRRIYLRAMALQKESIDDYYDYLVASERETRLFEDVLTVNVSYFFRNPDVFEIVRAELLRQLVERKKHNREAYLKVLSIGCSSGEEPYSIAMLLKEYFSSEPVKPHILGIDLDAGSVDYARHGVYDSQRMVFMPELLKKKYFDIIGQDAYAIKPEIKSMVVFRQEDIFTKDLRKYWDIVLCRNMFIYLNSEAQDQLLEKIRAACLDGSYLVLGKSENLSSRKRGGFRSLHSRERIYVVKKESL